MASTSLLLVPPRMLIRPPTHGLPSKPERDFFRLLAKVRHSAERATDAQVADRYGFSEEQLAQPRVLHDSLLKTASKALPAAATGVDLRAFAKHLALRHAADRIDTKFATEIIALLRTATRENTEWILPDFSHEQQWKQALHALICARRRMKHSPYHQDARINGVALAVIGLRRLGYDVRTLDGRVEFGNWEAAFLAWLDDTIRTKIGGHQLAERIFAGLSSRYVKEQGYYHITRSGGTSPRDIPRPGLPNGFLLNIAAKHIHSYPGRNNVQDDLAAVLHASELYAQAHDLTPSTSFEVFSRTHSTLLPLLKELAAFDTLFQIPQFRLRARAETTWPNCAAVG